MVWRDFDITVVCTSFDLPLVAELGARLLNHPRIQQVLLRDDTGAWNTDPTYPDGVYLGLDYRSPAGYNWKVDIWFVDDPEHQPDLGHIRTIPPQLNAETRAAILTIKAAWWARPEYRRTVKSLDIDTAVLRDGVRALADFDEWLAARPGAS